MALEVSSLTGFAMEFLTATTDLTKKIAFARITNFNVVLAILENVHTLKYFNAYQIQKLVMGYSIA